MTLLTLLAPVPEQQQIPTIWQSNDSGIRIAVEVAFRSNPLDATLLWEDISDYVNSVAITRGRSGELDRFQPSTAAITVTSTGRDFDPEYTSGPWYGYIKPNRPVRVRVQYDAGSGLTEYFVWQGFVDEWPQDYTGISAAQVTIPCSDAFAWLSTRGAPDPFSGELGSDLADGTTPLAWYRLNDAAGSTTALDSMGTYNGTFLGSTISFEQPALIAGATDNSIEFTDGGSTAGEGGACLVSPSPITGFPFAIEFVWALTFLGSGMMFQLNDDYSVSTSPDPFIRATKVAGQNQVVFYATNASGAYVMYQKYNVSTIADGNPHHFVFICDAQGLPSFYYDGVLQTNVDSSSSVAGQWTFDASMVDLLIGGYYDTPNNSYIGTGAQDEVIIWDVVPGADRIAARAAAVFGWPGDTTTERAVRVLDAAGWPDWWRDIGTGTTTCSTANITGSPFDQLMTLADTEGGQCYVDGQGRIVFRGRTEMGSDTRSAVSQAVFGDA